MRSAVQRREPISSRIGVMGMPGVGKSTFLNCALYQSDQGGECEAIEFATAASSASCTKVVREQTVTYEEGKHSVTFIDTMGWPDPERSKAAGMYDDVVRDAINNPEGLNCLVWVVKADRENHEIYKTYQAFMRELKQASCPILMIVNGCKNFISERKRLETKKPEKLEEIISKSRHEILRTAQELLKRIEFEEPDIQVHVAVDKVELEDKAVQWMIDTARKLPCRVSNVRSFARMQLDFANAESALRSHQQDMQCALDRLQAKADAEISKRAKKGNAGLAAGAASGAALWLASGIFTGGLGLVVGGTAALLFAASGAAGTGGAAIGESMSDDQLKQLSAEIKQNQMELKSGKRVQTLRAHAEARATEVRILSKYLAPATSVASQPTTETPQQALWTLGSAHIGFESPWWHHQCVIEKLRDERHVLPKQKPRTLEFQRAAPAMMLHNGRYVLAEEFEKLL